MGLPKSSPDFAAHSTCFFSPVISLVQLDSGLALRAVGMDTAGAERCNHGRTKRWAGRLAEPPALYPVCPVLAGRKISRAASTPCAPAVLTPAARATRKLLIQRRKPTAGAEFKQADNRSSSFEKPVLNQRHQWCLIGIHTCFGGIREHRQSMPIAADRGAGPPRRAAPGPENPEVSIDFRIHQQRTKRQITTCVPTSIARSFGILKYCEASLAWRANQMNSRSCQTGISDRAAGRSARRDRKYDVSIGLRSRCRYRRMSARGTSGASM